MNDEIIDEMEETIDMMQGLVNRSLNRIEELKKLNEKNKNCLNCKFYYFSGDYLKCKKEKKYRKICGEWVQK